MRAETVTLHPLSKWVEFPQRKGFVPRFVPLVPSHILLVQLYLFFKYVLRYLCLTGNPFTPMRFFNWFGQASRKQQTDELSRAIAGEQITIDWHQAEKQRTQRWITERKALAAQKRPELSSDGARYWFDLSESDEINRLEQSIQWNDSYIVHARNNILYYSQRKQSQP